MVVSHLKFAVRFGSLKASCSHCHRTSRRGIGLPKCCLVNQIFSVVGSASTLGVGGMSSGFQFPAASAFSL